MRRRKAERVLGAPTMWMEEIVHGSVELFLI